MKKAGTVALLVGVQNNSHTLIEAISDQAEILLIEDAVRQGVTDPVELLEIYRSQQLREEEDFGDYVEDLLIQGGVSPDVRQHAVQWFRSKAKIDQFKKMEQDATAVIAKYAYELFQSDPKCVDFTLAGPHAEVRVRVIQIGTRSMDEVA